jgi:hypothetical protein
VRTYRVSAKQSDVHAMCLKVISMVEFSRSHVDVLVFKRKPFTDGDAAQIAAR